MLSSERGHRDTLNHFVKMTFMSLDILSTHISDFRNLSFFFNSLFLCFSMCLPLCKLLDDNIIYFRTDSRTIPKLTDANTTTPV